MHQSAVDYDTGEPLTVQVPGSFSLDVPELQWSSVINGFADMPNAPTTVSERMRTEAKTGRRTQSSASHCMMTPTSGPGAGR